MAKLWHFSPISWIAAAMATALLCSHHGRVGAVTDPTDIEALKQVKASIDAATISATSCVGSWDFSVDPCSSRSSQQFTCGIECMKEENISVSSNATELVYERVISLQLDNAGYAGLLSPWLANLTALHFLRMADNAIAGEIPSSIGKLSQLMMLDLSFNDIGGRIPDSIISLRNLQSLNLAHNKLVGFIPPSLSKLSYLTELHLESNQITGPFPDLRNLGLLQTIDVSDNQLSGPFPRGLPSSVSSVGLRNNDLGGKLPKTITTLTQLNVLDLSNNTFAGAVNDMILAHPTLEQLNLSMNKMTQIRAHPKHVAHSPLIALDLSYNLFSGPLPSLFGLMRELSSLSLRYNFFHGPIPSIYGVKVTANGKYVKPLERFMLDGNYLTGPLPAPFMDLATDRIVTASFADNCFENCPTELTFCQGKSQKAQLLCRLFNSSP